MSVSAIVVPITIRARAGRRRTARALGQLVRELRDLERPGHPARAVEDQAGRALERALLQRRIDAALEALRRIRHEAVAARPSCDDLRLETMRPRAGRRSWPT